MNIDALLQVLKEEFALAAPDVDAALMQWLSDPAGGSRHAELVGTTFGRLAQASRLVGLEGAALVLDMLGESAATLASSSGERHSDGLAWLIGWQPPLAAYFEFVLCAPSEPSELCGL